jgi:hypothetical protein
LKRRKGVEKKAAEEDRNGRKMGRIRYWRRLENEEIIRFDKAINVKATLK